jgi:hypothetical protein
MPYAYTGHCYATTGEALEAFQKGFPLFGDTIWVWHTSSSINATGAITYSVVSKPSTTNSTSTRSGTLQLASCVDADFAAFDPVAAASMWATMFTITMTLWLIAKNAGVILAFFKKN